MLFHEALHLVFSTFSRQVLQHSRLTACLADCGVFDIFDDKRTICLTIDRHYGPRLYACLSHSPYKQQYDAIIAEVKLRHPNINAQIVDYVFQSIRYAWGKIKTVRIPKPAVLFPPVKKKRPSRQLPITNRPSPKKRPRRQTPTSPPYTLHPTPKKRPPSTPYTPHSTPQNNHPYQKRTARVVLYILAIMFTFAAIIMYNGGEMLMGTIFFGAMAICLIINHKLL